MDAMDAINMSEEDLMEEIMTQDTVLEGGEVEEDEVEEESYFYVEDDEDYEGAEVLYDKNEVEPGEEEQGEEDE